MKEIIIFEDKDIIVCHKPAGIPVQSAKIGTKDMVSMLRNYRKETEHITGEPYIGLVHRLDQPVQGLIVFAKHKKAAADLSNQKMKKHYQALVQGEPKESKGHLVDYLLKDARSNTSKIVTKETKGAKRAELFYRTLIQSNGITLVEVELVTGRHHQIRVQMAGAGLPLVGDRKYNQKGIENHTSGIALAAHRLAFMHPRSREEMLFEIEPKGASFEAFR